MVNYTEWEESVPKSIRMDSLWKMAAYRMALLLSDLAWHDVTTLSRDRRMLELSGQLYGAVGSVSANLAEGYSRGTGRDRARFYEYALGSARESRDWYYKARHVLESKLTDHRINLVTEIIRLLLTMVPQQRERVMREEADEYVTDSSSILDIDLNAFALLQDVPL